MAKSQNPMDIHRRSERKKTLQKNKAKRLKERDLKVAETQTIQSVTQEINKLERRGKKALDNNEIKKLERLRKELKIVQNKKAEDDLRRKQEREAEEAMARGGRKGGPIMRKTKEEIEAMNSQRYKYAKCSVYYDAQLNPFGAAPPGQIMLYWRHGGGKTHDFREAIDPSEPDVIVYQKERKQRQQEQQESKRDFRDRDRGDNRYYENSMRDPSDKRHPDQHQDNNRAATTTSTTRKPMHMPPPSQSHNQSRHDPSRPIPPPPPPPPPLPPTVNSDHDDKTSEPKQAKTNKTKDTTQLALPPPSLAVQRLNRQQALLKKKLGGKGKKSTKTSTNANLLLSDIWASQEEIHHDESLEGLVEQKPTNNDNYKTTSSNNEVMIKKKKKKPIQKDADVYDPLCPSADGYAEYRNKEQIQRSLAQKNQNKKHENDSIDNNETEQKSSSEETLQQQQQQIMIWYKDLSQNIQGPFPKEQILVWKQAGFFPPHTMIRFGVTKPFVSITILDHKEIDSSNNNDNVEEEEQNGVDARIAALKARDSSTSNNDDINATLMEHSGDGIEARIAALKAASGSDSTNDAHAAVSGVDARIAALKQRESSNADASENDHDGDNESGIEARIAALRNSLRPNNNGDSNEVGPSLPLQSQPQPQPQPQNEVAESYPTLDEIQQQQHQHHQESIDNEPEGDIPYPVDATNPANDHGEEDLTYPVDAAYPNSNEDEVPYPIDAAYPVNNVHYGENQDNYEDVAYPTNLEYPIYDDQNNHSNNEADGNLQDNYYHVENAPNYMSPTVSNTVVMKKKNTEKKLKKKTYSGDKDIVGFVPSHLQTKKRKRIPNTNSNSASTATRPTNNKSRPNPSFHNEERNNSKCNVTVTNEIPIITEKKNSLSDEIDNFMQEISSLK